MKFNLKKILILLAAIRLCLLFMIRCPLIAAVSQRPNVVLVLMDDFGVGQFSPLTKHLSVEDINYSHLQFVASLREKQYSPLTALEFSQQAMPTMDRLASNGVVFTNAFATSNLCSPSRAGLLTGCRNIDWGGYRNKDINICGFPDNSVLVEHLQSAGYETGFVGKWHMGGHIEALKNDLLNEHGLDPRTTDTDFYQTTDIVSELKSTGYYGSSARRTHPLNNGFDYYFGYNLWECPFYDSELIWENHQYTGLQKQYNTDLFTDKAIQFMDRAITDEKSFFIEIAYHAMHDPLDPLAPEQYRKRFHSGNEYLDKYFSHLYAVDQNIDKILNFLEQNEQLSNTMFIFTADNGATCTDRSVLPGNTPHSGYKGSLRLGGFKVPMLIWYPDKTKRRGMVSTAVSTMDLLPTVLDFADIDVPNNVDGKSLRILLSDTTDAPVHDHLILAGIHSRAWGFDRYLIPAPAVTWRDNSPGGWVVIKDPFLLRYVSDLPAGLYPDIPLGLPEQYELYNIWNDPLELHNLYLALPDTAKMLKNLYKELATQLPEPYYKKWRHESWEPIIHPR